MSRRRVGTWGLQRDGELVMDRVPARGCRVPKDSPEIEQARKLSVRVPDGFLLNPSERPERLIPKGNLPKIGRRGERRALLYVHAYRQGVGSRPKPKPPEPPPSKVILP